MRLSLSRNELLSGWADQIMRPSARSRADVRVLRTGRIRVPKKIACRSVVLWLAGTLLAQAAPAANTLQRETDEYTRYELQAPDSASFAIRYEVTATTADAKYFYNPIRKGSVATDESVIDVMTG